MISRDEFEDAVTTLRRATEKLQHQAYNGCAQAALPLALPQATRDLAKKWHNTNRDTHDERFFGFMAEWVAGPRTQLEYRMSQVFLQRATAFRVDFLIDLQYAGKQDPPDSITGRQDGPLVYWLPVEMGSHLFTHKGLSYIKDLPKDKREATLYLLSGDEVIELGKAEDYAR